MKINWQFGNRRTLTKYNGFYTIDKEVIYLCGGNHQNATLYAIDTHSGREKWFFNSNSIDNDIFTSPTIYKQNIYLVSVRGKLFSLDFATGHLNWEIKIDTSQTSFPLTSSPITVNEIIYVGSNNGYLYAFDTNTGKEVWELKITETSIVNSPIIAKDRKTICVETSDGCIYGIELKTPRKKWKYINQETTFNLNGYPIIHNDLVYSGGGRTSFLALDLESGKQIWSFHPESSQALTSPAIADNIICFGDNNGTLWGIEAENGRVIWTYNTITTWNKIGFGWIDTPVINNGIVYLAGRGYLRALDLQTGKELWKYEAPTSEIFFREPTNLISAIANELGKVFIDNPFSEFLSPIIINNLIYVVIKNGDYQSLLSLTVD